MNLKYFVVDNWGRNEVFQHFKYVLPIFNWITFLYSKLSSQKSGYIKICVIIQQQLFLLTKNLCLNWASNSTKDLTFVD